MRRANWQPVPDPKPARATIQAAALVNNARIEVSVIAVKQ
jgi:enamine deaminase RidA (YjgF/YER057c/UK114 family)